MVTGPVATAPPPCPACASPRSRRAFEIGGHTFRRCRRCASLFLEDPPPAGKLQPLYEGERYFANPDYDAGELCGYRDYLADRGEIEQKFACVLSHLEHLVPRGRLLDVGSGPGLLLSAARDRGWDPLGLDVNEWAARTAREELGVEVLPGTLAGAELESGGFDAVTMMDLIEHDPEPDALLEEAARVTRPGGALAVLTPDAGSPTTRILGRRWPEVQRAPEHTILYSVRGLSSLLARHGFQPTGWHSIGKASTLATLAADLAPVAPALGRPAQRWLAGHRLGERGFELDPRAKFVLYARRAGTADGAATETPRPHAPARLPKAPPAPVETAIREELEHLAQARHLCDWMFAQFAAEVRGSVAEVGAGIGTFSERILDAGASELLLVEPEPSCAAVLERRFGDDERVRLVRESLPDAPSLAAGAHDLILCQNVLEHVGDDAASVNAMARALKPGGTLALLVPAGPRLFGSLDRAYGHHRRYSRARVQELIAVAGLTTRELRPFNLLGVPGWWLKSRRAGARVGPRALSAYEVLVRAWRPLEERVPVPLGLSLVALADRPGAPASAAGSSTRPRP